jgi:hypothetical protein
MKYIITERQHRLLKEDEYLDIINMIDVVEKIIDNYELIDCNDRVFLYENEYASIFCELFNQPPKDKLISYYEDLKLRQYRLVRNNFRDHYPFS